MDIEIINLDDEDEDLISICNDYLNQENNSSRNQSLSAVVKQNKNTVLCFDNTKKNINYFNVYQKKNDSLNQIFPNSTYKRKYDDFDDDDLMQVVPFLHKFPVEKQRETSNAIKKPTEQLKITSFFTQNKGILISNQIDKNEFISDEDAIAIVSVLEEFDQTFDNKKHNDSSNTSIIGLEDFIFDDLELECYNENAAIIQSLSIVDPDLEHLDPNPDIHKLLWNFDKKFFDFFLSKQKLKLDWAKNFNCWAGAFYPNRDGVPTILLSSKLLIFRPRRDLVETLLHEMIHAFIALQGLSK